ncbi:MAG: radical SAM family heme chaperone HemW [Candidatus Rokubacteria bacterium]|nr:radical SAM family heme chaperone HemW [Candidatus Rokubacteria bacterium]
MASFDSWIPRSGSIGAYLHVPFCTKRCGYCSFNTAPVSPGAVARFLPTLLGEMDLVARAPWAGAVDLRSVFLGGGTPSLLPAEAMAEILDRLRSRFGIEAGAEITVECNPESVSLERLSGYRRAGVTRISLGVQSLDDRILPTLDRLHTAAQACRAFDAARAAGFEDVSVDLIYGLPALDLATWEETVKGALGWGPDHLSAYALTLDEGSLWHAAASAGRAAGRRGAGAPPTEASEISIVLPPEDTVTAQYTRLTELAAEAGFEHYEVSNYARPGHRSTHNQIYWRAEEYLGLGPGACGFLGDVRYGNVKSVERYGAMVAGGEPPVGTHETLTPRQRMAERLILGLRLGDGVPAAWLDERAALGPARLQATLAAWRERGLLGGRDGRVRLTEAGFLLSDALFIDLL